MEKEYLLKKWLNDELSSEEQEAFRNLEDASIYEEIIQEAKRFKVSENYTVANFETFKNRKDTKNITPNVQPLRLIKVISSIAAMLLIAISIYFMYTNTTTTTVSTEIAQKETIQLPDFSEVTLNAKSTISYQPEKWNEKRKVDLKGEAFFNVAKGAKFDVVTNDGIVSVLGTSFNVKQRDDYFEVSCYEGLVSVAYKDKTVQLPAGSGFRLEHGSEMHTQIKIDEPQWIADRSVFAKVQIQEVFKELERQFDVVINTSQIDKTTLFSGGFEHTDLTDALLSITAPLKLKFEIKENRKVVIYDTTH